MNWSLPPLPLPKFGQKLIFCTNFCKNNFDISSLLFFLLLEEKKIENKKNKKKIEKHFANIFLLPVNFVMVFALFPITVKINTIIISSTITTLIVGQVLLEMTWTRA